MPLLRRPFRDDTELDDGDDQQPQQGLIAPPPTDSLPPSVYTPVTLPSKPAGPKRSGLDEATNQTAADQTKLAGDTERGSGIDRFASHHRFLGPLARIADVAGSIAAPAIAVNIPGSSLNFRRQLAQDRAGLASDVGTQKEQADIGHTQAETDALQNPQPKPKEEDWEVVPNTQGPNGEPILREKNSGDMKMGKLPLGAVAQSPESLEHVATDDGYFSLDKRTGKLTPLTYNGKQIKPQQTQKPDSPEQQYLDEYQKSHPGASIREAERQYAVDHQAPQHDQRVLGVINGKVVELRPGMDVPQGTQTLSGDLNQKPSADEQKRADLAENLKENLDHLEDILTRRPELFGPVAGRLTGLRSTVGTDDPDIAAMETIKHQLGMAQISAHGMRSAQGVAAAADSLVNGFHNSPKALKGAIDAARQSVQTFSNDAGNNRPRAGVTQGSTQSNAQPKFSVGQAVTIHGKQMKVTVVHPDGSFDAQ